MDDARVEAKGTGIFKDRRGGGLIQALVLVGALALAAVPATRALRGALDRKSACTGDAILSMTVTPCGGDAPGGGTPPAPPAGIAASPGGRSPDLVLVGNTEPLADPADGEAPALGDADGVPLVVLPFPGQAAVSCTVVTKGAPDDLKPGQALPKDKACKDKPGVRIQATGELAIERTPTKLDVKNGGCPLQELSISVKLQVELNGKFKTKQVSGALAQFTGSSLKFTVKVSPDQADAIARGDREPPNPVDPTSLLPGESIELTREFFEGAKASGQFRQLQAELGFEEGRKLSVGVKRLDANTVRISVGDTDAVRTSLGLGVTEGDVSIGLSGKEELSKGTVRSVDLDISTPEGFAAYQEFLATGKLPAPGSPGVVGSATTDAVDFTDTARVEGKFKQVKVGKVLGDAEGNAIETKRSDGSRDVVIASRKNDVGFAIKESTPAGGGPAKTTFTLLLEGADPAKIAAFEAATGVSLGADASGNIRRDFTEADLEAVRQQAIDQLLQAARQRGIDIDRAELERLLREDPNKLRRAGLGTHPAFELAAAESSAEILRQLALFGGPQGDPNRVLDNLLGFAFNTAAVRNGRGARPKDNPNSVLPGKADPAKCK